MGSLAREPFTSSSAKEGINANAWLNKTARSGSSVLMAILPWGSLQNANNVELEDVGAVEIIVRCVRGWARVCVCVGE